VCLIIDHLHDHRQVCGELDEARGVNHAVGPEPRDAVDDGRASSSNQ
jgi:hypothetical protein